jgi:hypothetical protein
MALHHNPRIVTDSLRVLYDAADPNSYPGSGNTLSNLAPSAEGETMSLYGNVAYGSIANGVVNLSGAGNNTGNGCILRSVGSITDTVNYSFTTVGWIKRTNSRDAEVMSYRETWQRLAFTIFDTGMGFYQRQIASPYSTNSTTVSVANDLNTWNCYGLVRSGNQWSFYKDGVLIQTNTFTPDETLSGVAYHVGAAWSDDDYLSNGMNGSVGPFMHYTRALSPSEIMQNYKAHKKRFQ